ncbi:hypothetical protein AVEN_229523-1 [Araneus ventricosus]|uniref:Uncharacterized protein n=1 Tax=Araneus ventricosus TaxID=182803 RepID=A0A4Y2EJD2_ARAVE|nr:hypothetical protein AVEN_229523-1 [Araneus ventricosus]
MAAASIALAMYYDKEMEPMLKEDLTQLFRDGRFNRDKHELWKLIEMVAVEKLEFLPDLLKIRVSKLIRPIHLEARRWIRDHDCLLNISAANCYLTYKSILCWKTDGRIDGIKTAKKLVQDKNIDAKIRFALACTYFLEDEVLALWYGDNEVNKKNILLNGSNRAMRFWMRYLKSGSWRKKSWKAMINRYFKSPIFRRSDIRIKVSCFFPYLSWEGKKNYFPHLQSLDKIHDDDFRLCMQAMDERECMELCCADPARSLYCCLEWPLQSLFMEMARQLWMHMNANQFHAVLDRIVLWYILEGVEDFDYVGLLKEFWRLIPASFKDEIKKIKKYFVPIDVALNYDKENTSLSLPETLEEYVRK